jgi:hypothetical protein
MAAVIIIAQGAAVLAAVMAVQVAEIAVRSHARALRMQSVTSDGQTGFGTNVRPAGKSGTMGISQPWFAGAKFPF